MSEPTIKGDHSPEYRRLPRILFVSEDTSSRTVMAEQFMSKMGAGLVDVLSAGMEVTPVDRRTVQVMKEEGFDVREQVGKTVKKDLMEWGDIIIVMCQIPGKVHPYIPSGAIRKEWPIDNPVRAARDMEDTETFVEVRDNIKRRVQQFINAIKLSRR
jgi:arsenate reductase